MLGYLDLETELTDEERQFRDKARIFLGEEIRPDIADHFLEETFPEELLPMMGDHGFFAPTIDEYGLPGVCYRAYGLLMQELGACDAGIRSMASVQGALVMYPIYTYGSDDQKDEWLPGLAAGTDVGGFALTEPEHGSDPSRMESGARKDGDEYVLNGEKRWCTNSPIADILVVWARDLGDDNEPIRGFLVEPWRDGLDINEISDKLSLRASVSGEFTMDEVRIPVDNVLPSVKGMKGPLSCLTQARYGIAWSAVGAAQDCFETLLEYAQEREQFDEPIARFQLQQSKLAEMATEITTSQLLALG